MSPDILDTGNKSFDILDIYHEFLNDDSCKIKNYLHFLGYLKRTKGSYGGYSAEEIGNFMFGTSQDNASNETNIELSDTLNDDDQTPKTDMDTPIIDTPEVKINKPTILSRLRNHKAAIVIALATLFIAGSTIFSMYRNKNTVKAKIGTSKDLAKLLDPKTFYINKENTPLDEELVPHFPKKKNIDIIPTDSNFVQIDSNVVNIDSTFIQPDSNFVQIDSNVVNLDSNVVQLDSNVVNLDSNFVQIDSNVVQIDSNVVQLDSNVVQLDSNDVIDPKLTQLINDGVIEPVDTNIQKKVQERKDQQKKIKEIEDQKKLEQRRKEEALKEQQEIEAQKKVQERKDKQKKIKEIEDQKKLEQLKQIELKKQQQKEALEKAKLEKELKLKKQQEELVLKKQQEADKIKKQKEELALKKIQKEKEVLEKKQQQELAAKKLQQQKEDAIKKQQQDSIQKIKNEELKKQQEELALKKKLAEIAAKEQADLQSVQTTLETYLVGDEIGFADATVSYIKNKKDNYQQLVADIKAIEENPSYSSKNKHAYLCNTFKTYGIENRLLELEREISEKKLLTLAPGDMSLWELEQERYNLRVKCDKYKGKTYDMPSTTPEKKDIVSPYADKNLEKKATLRLKKALTAILGNIEKSKDISKVTWENLVNHGINPEKDFGMPAKEFVKLQPQDIMAIYNNNKDKLN